MPQLKISLVSAPSVILVEEQMKSMAVEDKRYTMQHVTTKRAQTCVHLELCCFTRLWEQVTHDPGAQKHS